MFCFHEESFLSLLKMGTVNDFYADLGNGDLDEHDFHAQVEKYTEQPI